MLPQFKFKTREKWETILPPVLFLLLAVLTCVHLLILKNTHPGKILQNALQNMEQNQDCLVFNIQEKGPSYKVDFEGNFKGEEIQGRFPAYELEIYKHASGALFVKDLKDNLWKKTPELELQALEEFFASPFEILTAWSHLFRKARYVNLKEEKGKIISLPVPPPEIEKAALLRHYPRENISRLECIVFLEPDSLFINQIVFSLQDDQFASTVNRTFSFNFNGEKDSKIVPAGVEKLLENQAL